MTTINPYLNFPGTTEEAFNFYKSVFGGEFVMVQRFGQTPEADKVPADLKDKIMHISLPIGGSILMATDALESMGHKITAGTNFHLSISPDSKDETDKMFAAISAGGNNNDAISRYVLGRLFWHVYRQVWYSVDVQL